MDNNNLENFEAQRVAAVQRYLNFNVSRESDLQQIVNMASYICESPIAMITLLDKEIQLIKAKRGTKQTEMPRKTSFCSHAIELDKVMEVRDASQDPRFENAPAVANAPFIKFYASANLKTYDGFNVGTLCVYDIEPKKLSDEQISCLETLAKQVSHLMELDRSLAQLQEQNKALREIARIESHEIRQPVSSILGLVSLMKEPGEAGNEEYLNLLDRAAIQLDERVQMVVGHTAGFHN
ncbi:MAG: sensory histidine kinase AtoS [Sphingobacteriaceae bacterium]|jgi:GAF domain-containing protein|nr:sensory histidine kinase AtoS [Sphingobacteriaceae bacterium]